MTEAHSPLDVLAPSGGVVNAIRVSSGEAVSSGQLLALVEVMKMETEICAPTAGTVDEICVALGDQVDEGTVIARLAAGNGAASATPGDPAPGNSTADRVSPRADLAEVLDRQRRARDEGRPESVAWRRERGGRTARENLDDLIDPESFVEYGALAVAAQRARLSPDELISKTAADGLIGGTATVNAERFGAGGRCAVVSYDYTVLAGTQGATGHFKKDRLFEIVERLELPVILFAEGGGGRPGDTDYATGSALTARAFALWGRLSGLVPRIAIVAGRCFAGNAALAGTADILIATENSNIGMGGPAMIEGGGLGAFAPEDVGPIDVQEANGVVDIRVADEEAAVAVAKQLLSYFQGDLSEWQEPDQQRLRELVPESRRRSYEIRDVLSTLADEGSMLELRRRFGVGMITAFMRLEGRAVGVIANDPAHLAGAITGDGADKAARMMQLCEAFGLPLLSVVDTPGMMVGPEVEETALVRHCSRLFAIGPNLTVPLLALVVGRGYGLGAQAMVGGSFLEPQLSLAWPTGELGPMGIEGAVQLGMKKELEAIADGASREQRFKELVAAMRQHFAALNVATFFEIDDVVDPAETRELLVRSLAASGPAPSREGKRLPWVDTW